MLLWPELMSYKRTRLSKVSVENELMQEGSAVGSVLSLVLMTVAAVE